MSLQIEYNNRQRFIHDLLCHLDKDIIILLDSVARLYSWFLKVISVVSSQVIVLPYLVISNWILSIPWIHNYNKWFLFFHVCKILSLLYVFTPCSTETKISALETSQKFYWLLKCESNCEIYNSRYLFPLAPGHRDFVRIAVFW